VFETRSVTSWSVAIEENSGEISEISIRILGTQSGSWAVSHLSCGSH